MLIVGLILAWMALGILTARFLFLFAEKEMSDGERIITSVVSLAIWPVIWSLIFLSLIFDIIRRTLGGR